MKKIGILTINDDNNYGNRLQNYAVQEVLKKYGYIVHTINNQLNVVGINVIIKKIKIMIKKFFPSKLRKRSINFMKFNRFIKYSNIFIDRNHISNKLNEQYDYFFVGSDQVWNPNFPRISDIDFLTFADDYKKNSLAASFGVEKIPNDVKGYYKEKLKKFNYISVREDAGKKIVKELINRDDVEVLIDPTMMLSVEEWNKVLKKPKNVICDKYILNYFLGNVSHEIMDEIKRIANENNCQIINILDENDPFYVSGPSEFLWLEKNAFLICTDSFHSSVFALLYNKPFIVFERKDKEQDMSSRIETLISKFALKNRRFTGHITKENLEHDYTLAYDILSKEREKSNYFIRKVLDIKVK